MFLLFLFALSVSARRTVTFGIDNPAYVARSQIDPNFALSRAFIDDEEMARLNSETRPHFLKYTGFDTSVLATLDYAVLPVNVGGVESYGAGTILSDTFYGRSREMDNYYTQFGGYYMSFRRDGIFPGGLFHGKKFYAGDSMLIGYYPFLKIGANWTSSQNKETKENNFCYTDLPGKFFTNLYGLRDLYGRFVCVDQQGVPVATIQENAFQFTTASNTTAYFKRGVYSTFVI